MALLEDPFYEYTGQYELFSLDSIALVSVFTPSFYRDKGLLKKDDRLFQ